MNGYFLIEITMEISAFQAFQNAKKLPSSLLAEHRSDYAFLGLTYTNT